MDNYVSNPVNNEEEWSEFIAKKTNETSDNLSIAIVKIKKQ